MPARLQPAQTHHGFRRRGENLRRSPTSVCSTAFLWYGGWENSKVFYAGFAGFPSPAPATAPPGSTTLIVQKSQVVTRLKYHVWYPGNGVNLKSRGVLSPPTRRFPIGRRLGNWTNQREGGYDFDTWMNLIGPHLMRFVPKVTPPPQISGQPSLPLSCSSPILTLSLSLSLCSREMAAAAVNSVVACAVVRTAAIYGASSPPVLGKEICAPFAADSAPLCSTQPLLI